MLAIAAWTATASATVRISGDNGGQIGSYLAKYSVLRKSSERVFDGKCASACTLVVNMISRNHICVTSRAVLAFHSAWSPAFTVRSSTCPAHVICGRIIRRASSTGLRDMAGCARRLFI